MIEVFGLPPTSFVRNCIPMFTLVFATVLDMEFSPSLIGTGLHAEHIVLYTWIIYNPSLMPVSLILGLGIFQDCITGLTLGTSSIILVCFYGLTIYNRQHFNQHAFWIVWLGFASIEVFIQGLTWICAIFLVAGTIDGLVFAKQTLLTIGTYPLIGWLILKIHNRLHVGY